MVYGAPSHHPPGGHPSLREHLHRDVLYLYIILGIQDLLRLRVHAARLVSKLQILPFISFGLIFNIQGFS